MIEVVVRIEDMGQGPALFRQRIIDGLHFRRVDARRRAGLRIVDEETIVISQTWDLFHFDAHNVSMGNLAMKYLRSVHPRQKKRQKSGRAPHRPSGWFMLCASLETQSKGLMNKVLQEIIDLLDVEPIEENLFRGQNHNTEHVFGGQVLAQALASAFRTVDPEHSLHSLHSYFLRAGDWTRPILYEVDRIRDGRSFSTRRVAAIQNGRTIFTLACSGKKAEEGLDHSLPMPDVPPPESLRGDLETYTELAKPNLRWHASLFASKPSTLVRLSASR